MISQILMAEWIHKQLNYESSADDVYDVLLGNITSPRDFVDDVKQLAVEYTGRQNGR